MTTQRIRLWRGSLAGITQAQVVLRTQGRLLIHQVQDPPSPIRAVAAIILRFQPRLLAADRILPSRGVGALALAAVVGTRPLAAEAGGGGGATNRFSENY